MDTESLIDLTESLPEIIFSIDRHGKIAYLNEKGLAVSGYSRDVIIGMDAAELIHPDEREAARERITASLAGEANHVRLWRIYTSEKKSFPARVSFTTRMKNGKPDSLVGVIIDISSFLSAEVKSKNNGDFTLRLMDMTREPIILHRDGTITDCNNSFCELSGYSNSDLSGRLFTDLVPEEYRDTIIRNMCCSPLPCETKIITESGGLVDVQLTARELDDNNQCLSLIMVQDISLRKRAEHLQNHDELTDLLNIRGVSRRLKEEIDKALATGKRLAVMCIRFAHDEYTVIKDIDIELERVLLRAVPIEATERLSNVLFRDDLIARTNDNEYITVHSLPAGDNISNSVTLIKKVLDTFRPPFANGIKLNAEVGVTFFPDDLSSNNPNRIIANARYACEQAALQSEEYAFYDEKAHLATRQKIEFIKDLIIAVKEEKCRNFVLFYQAKVDGKMKIVGMEALIRWKNPTWAPPGGELVSPLLFISAAEEMGLINDLGRWVLEKACRQTKKWQDLNENFKDLQIAVNVSPGQLNEEFVEFVSAVLEKTGLPPHTLELEITERESIKDKNIRILDMFRTRNISIAIDDFGIEYSSLSKLPKLAINTIKLDKSYIDHIATDTDYEKLVSHTIGMVHGFNYHVVAEGVELQAQADKLFNEMNCDRIQGYFFSRPLPADLFEKTLYENLVKE